MADITISLNPRQEKAVQYMTNKFNLVSKRAPLSPQQYLKNTIDSILAGWVGSLDESERLTKAELYQKASPEDKLAVDTLLEKYNK